MALRSEDSNVQGIRGLVNYTENNLEGQGRMQGRGARPQWVTWGNTLQNPLVKTITEGDSGVLLESKE